MTKLLIKILKFLNNIILPIYNLDIISYYASRKGPHKCPTIATDNNMFPVFWNHFVYFLRHFIHFWNKHCHHLPVSVQVFVEELASIIYNILLAWKEVFCQIFAYFFGGIIVSYETEISAVQLKGHAIFNSFCHVIYQVYCLLIKSLKDFSWQLLKMIEIYMTELFYYFPVKFYIDLLISNTILYSLAKLILVLISIAYFTIAERKAMAAIQRRKGPEVTGIWGLLQPFADALKLLTKTLLIPTRSNKIIFLIAPVAILILSLLSWALIPFSLIEQNSTLNIQNLIYSTTNTIFESNTVSSLKYTVLLLFAISSLNVYGIIIAGWASNSKYAFLGSLRSAAQMISYEVTLGATLLSIVLLTNSLNLSEIIIQQAVTGWFIFVLFPCALIFWICMLAETNRTPFDLPEAEAELVAGYNVEYSSIIFAMFFLAEYSNMILMSTLLTILFFGGWNLPVIVYSVKVIMAIKITLFCFMFVLVRATLPRFKYNQLMNIAWKYLMPLALAYFVLLEALIFFIAVVKQQVNIKNTLNFRNLISNDFFVQLKKKLPMLTPRSFFSFQFFYAWGFVESDFIKFLVDYYYSNHFLLLIFWISLPIIFWICVFLLILFRIFEALENKKFALICAKLLIFLHKVFFSIVFLIQGYYAVFFAYFYIDGQHYIILQILAIIYFMFEEMNEDDSIL